MNFKKSIQLILMLNIVSVLAFAQQASGREFRRTGIHNGNLVRTVFGNWGVVGQPADKGPRGAWINDNNGYIGDVSPVIGFQVILMKLLPDTELHLVQIRIHGLLIGLIN